MSSFLLKNSLFFTVAHGNNIKGESQISRKSEESMTPKELLYIEDALGHHQQLQTSMKDMAGQLNDPKLKSFVEDLASKQGQSFQQFFMLLNS